MSNRYDQYLQSPNIRRTLDTIRYAEGTDKGEAGYRTMFGGDTFDTSGGWRHPDRVVNRPGYSSAAAGAYQFLPGTWGEASKAVGATDFSPANQDRAALFLIERRGVSLDKLAKSGFDDDDLERLAPEWASLPTKKGKSFYGQPVKSHKELQARFSQGNYSAGVAQASTSPETGGPASGSIASAPPSANTPGADSPPKPEAASPGAAFLDAYTAQGDATDSLIASTPQAPELQKWPDWSGIAQQFAGAPGTHQVPGRWNSQVLDGSPPTAAKPATAAQAAPVSTRRRRRGQGGTRFAGDPIVQQFLGMMQA